jgi:hypothetical protein
MIRMLGPKAKSNSHLPLSQGMRNMVQVLFAIDGDQAIQILQTSPRNHGCYFS